MRERIMFRWAWVVVLVGLNALYSTSCGIVGRTNLAQQLQEPLATTIVPISDASVVQITAKLSEQWGRRNNVSELFSYGAEVSLAGLTTAVIASPQAAVGLGIGQAIWMALLRIFRPDEHGLVYMEGLEDLNDALAEFILCSASAGRTTVSAKEFTPCGAGLFVKIAAASNNVARGRWQLRPRRSDLDKVQPLPIEGQPQSLTLPRSAVPVP